MEKMQGEMFLKNDDMQQIEGMNPSINEEMKKMLDISSNQVHKISEEKERRKAGLEACRNELNKEMEKEKEKLRKMKVQVMAKLIKKQALEMEIESLRGTIELMKIVASEGSIQIVELLEKELKDIEEELEVEGMH